MLNNQIASLKKNIAFKLIESYFSALTPKKRWPNPVSHRCAANCKTNHSIIIA